MMRTIATYSSVLTRGLRLGALALVMALCVPYHSEAAGRESLTTRFLRGAYVIRHLHPGEHWPPVTVPRRIRTDDTTNTLVKHRDASFVLNTISRDLAAAAKGKAHPEAAYYSAHAFSLLGNHAEAAKAMKSYIAKTPYREADHLFLVKELYAASNFQGVHEAARTWQILDGSDDTCSEDRLMYVWGSYHATGQHREAMEAVLSDPCASWMGQLFFARSSLALGDEKNAETRLASVLEAFPDRERDIHMLWNTLASADKFP